jgi:hypothetical protein
MSSTGPHHHRGGALKQTNKPHSGFKGHASKRSLKQRTGGRVSVSGRDKDGGGSPLDRSRADRRNQSVQLRKNKRMQQAALRRAQKAVGPHVVAVVALAAHADPKALIRSLLTADASSASGSELGGVGDGGGGGAAAAAAAAAGGAGARFVSSLGVETANSVAGRPITAAYPAHRHKRFTFLEAARDMTAILDAAKVADTVMFVIPLSDDRQPEECCDDLGARVLSALLNQGVGNVIGALQGLEHVAPKKATDLRKFGQRFVRAEFGERAKAIEASAPRQVGGCE